MTAMATAPAAKSAIDVERIVRTDIFAECDMDSSLATTASPCCAFTCLDNRIEPVRAPGDLEDVEGRDLATGHTGRSLRHAGERNAGDLRPFGQEAIDDLDRDMSADDITVHERKVTRCQLVRDAVLLVQQCQIVRRHDVDLESVLSQVVGIAFTAAALRVLVERELSPLVGSPGACRHRSS